MHDHSQQPNDSQDGTEPASHAGLIAVMREEAAGDSTLLGAIDDLSGDARRMKVNGEAAMGSRQSSRRKGPDYRTGVLASNWIEGDG